MYGMSICFFGLHGIVTVSRRVGTKQIGHFEQHSAGHHAPTGQDGKLKKNTFYTNKRRLESRTIVGFFSCPFQIDFLSDVLIADIYAGIYICRNLDILHSPCNSDFPIWLVVVSTGGITSHLFVGLHVAELLKSTVLRLSALSRIRIASSRVHLLLPSSGSSDDLPGRSRITRRQARMVS